MKRLFSVITVTATALSLAGSTGAFAQEPPMPPPPPVAIVRDVKDLTEDAFEKAQDEVQKAQSQVKQQMAQMDQRLTKLVGDRFFIGAGRGEGGAPGKSLVIRSRDMDTNEQGNLEEDLAVMTHILDKTVDEKIDNAPPGRTAMGINVMFTPGESRVRNLYLDGYGALFIMNVNFPLLPSPIERNVEKEKAPEDSTWEEAKREVYGQPGSSASAAGPVQKYHAQQVNDLKDALTESLKNAAHIRGLKSDDWMTVCVFGGTAGTTRSRGRSVGGGGFGAVQSQGDTGGGGGVGGGGFGGGGGSSGGGFIPPGGPFRFAMSGRDDGQEGKTTMTIRVKKSDVDAFAKGKLTADAFRKAVAITIYGGSASGS